MVRLIGAVLILFGTVGIGYDRMRQIKRHYEGPFRLAGMYAQKYREICKA